jgi:hypothetical protein
MQKVFRARLDEGRAYTKLTDVSQSEEKIPFMTNIGIGFNRLTGKTHQFFFNPTYYNIHFLPINDNFYLFNSSANYHFYDFPFLLAHKSDASRYM